MAGVCAGCFSCGVPGAGLEVGFECCDASSCSGQGTSECGAVGLEEADSDLCFLCSSLEFSVDGCWASSRFFHCGFQLGAERGDGCLVVGCSVEELVDAGAESVFDGFHAARVSSL